MNSICGPSPHLSLQTVLSITVPVGIESFKAEAIHKAITAAGDRADHFCPAGLGIRSLLKTWDEVQLTFRASKNSLLNTLLKKQVCETERWFSSWIFVTEQMIMMIHCIFIERT